MGAQPRVVLVTRPTPYEMLRARHATREQARFFLEMRGQSIEALEREHERFDTARRGVLASVATSWRIARVERDDLDRFLFEPDDIVVALGQDGLVANVAKYLTGQVVVGLNSEPEAYAGILVRHDPAQARELLAAAVEPGVPEEERTLAECRLDDAQRLLALNEVFVGHVSHQTARYRLEVGGSSERQMSSGMIVATGTGATGWASSICRGLREPPPLPAPADPALAFLVREPFASPTSGVALIAGAFGANRALEVTSEMESGGVIFADGIEADRIAFGYGTRAEVRVAEERLRLLA
jgi:NAD kinase